LAICRDLRVVPRSNLTTLKLALQVDERPLGKSLLLNVSILAHALRPSMARCQSLLLRKLLNSELNSLGSHNGVLCVRDRALILKDPSELSMLCDAAEQL